jgi:DNA-binding LytR/AlgR family response regulator
MKVLIIEDEPLAAEKLAAYLLRHQPDAQIIAQLSSVAQVVDFFSNNTQAASLELIFSDVELTDGQVFTALEQLDLPCPVLFTTAYDQYWMQVFQYQAVDYLLKPFSYPRFAEAMLNFAQLKHKLQQASTVAETRYKKRFLLRKGQSLSLLPVTDISLIRAANGVLLATDKHNTVHILTESHLGEIESQLDPSEFFRLNRSFIAAVDAIASITTLSKTRLKVELTPLPKRDIVVSYENNHALRDWLNGVG